MNVLVANSHVPFVHGGAEELAKHLVKNLNATPGVTAKLCKIPFRWHPQDRLPLEIVLNRSLRFDDVDMLIPLKFPAYHLPCKRKTYWIVHQLRQAYDLWGTRFGLMSDDPEGRSIRAEIIRADNLELSDARKLFVNSDVTQQRLLHFNGIDSEILYPPLNDPELLQDIAYQPFIFAGGRMNEMKRQHRLVEAMQYVKSDIKLVIVGPPSTDAYTRQLLRLVDETGQRDRVVIKPRFVSRRFLGWLNSHARACAYLPIDEDSFGYVAMEACEAAKPVLTCADSGGVTDLVQHQTTGWVSEDDPEALAEGIDFLCESETRARRLGREAFDRWRSFELTWQSTVERLLS